MKAVGMLIGAGCATLLSACASLGPVAGMEPGKLVQYECEGGKAFSARIEEDFAGVRLRTHEGSANLARGENDEFKGDGWVLRTQSGIQLIHKDKVVAKGCRRA